MNESTVMDRLNKAMELATKARMAEEIIEDILIDKDVFLNVVEYDVATASYMLYKVIDTVAYYQDRILTDDQMRWVASTIFKEISDYEGPEFSSFVRTRLETLIRVSRSIV